MRTALTLSCLWLTGVSCWLSAAPHKIGQEHAMERHLADGEEYTLSTKQLAEWGLRIFRANWTEQDGAGRPLSKGNGQPLSDPTSPLVGQHAFNRVSGPDANSCAGCHNSPYGIPGGNADFAASVFVLGQRFDFATFDRADTIPLRGTVDAQQHPVTLQSVGNLRSSPGMFGAGYVEMLAREITGDLQTIRNKMRPGETQVLVSKGIDFGKLTRRPDGSWDVWEVNGLPRASMLSPTPIDDRPTLVIRPWHQAGNVVSLREFSNNAFNQHHGMQSTERFGSDTDPDNDGVTNELTRADLTAVAIFQAVIQVPGRVIPNDPEIERAVAVGELVFDRVGCTSCHIPSLPLEKRDWAYSEPNPYNPRGNLRTGDARPVLVNLIDPSLPQPRLAPTSKEAAALAVPAYTDFKLHDIGGEADVEHEPLDQNQAVWSPKFRQGNARFLTKRLWGAANQPPFFHHGLFTTLRQCVLAHHGEAESSLQGFLRSSEYDRDSLIEFLKSLQVLPPGTKSLVVDENFRRKTWPKWSPAEVAGWIKAKGEPK
jgi:cytochrome c peroxidase